MSGEPREPEVGEIAPEFSVETRHGKLFLSELAARFRKLVLTSQDSYRYHQN